jgi:hypothetical protein
VALALVSTRMIERVPHLKEGPAILLAAATVISAVSFFFHDIAKGQTLGAEAILGYAPVVMGAIAMALCIRARKKTVHKRLVVLYAVLLAPFAFSYPAWIAFLWIVYISGRYKGPMP